MVSDKIEREIVIAAPVEKVWTILTDPEHIGRWFGDAGATGEAKPGGELVVHWKDYGEQATRIERMEPPHFFSYRWLYEKGQTPAVGNSTLVEFTLTPDGGNTRLRVVESGFSALDRTDEKKIAQHKDNTEGWKSELEELRVYAEQQPA
jgi:uncharacterized protein YndB with AHSA1/START domain